MTALATTAVFAEDFPLADVSDVFEELEDDKQARLLASRTTEQIADVLAPMRADDAADALL